MGRKITWKTTLDNYPICDTNMQQRHESLISGKLIELSLGKPFCPRRRGQPKDH